MWKVPDNRVARGFQELEKNGVPAEPEHQHRSEREIEHAVRLRAHGAYASGSGA
jgi:hypothetical protein